VKRRPKTFVFFVVVNNRPLNVPELIRHYSTLVLLVL
jgi:hypothetical protein